MHDTVQQHVAVRPREGGYEQSWRGTLGVVYFELPERRIPNVGQPMTNRPSNRNASQGNYRRSQVRVEYPVNRPLVAGT